MVVWWFTNEPRNFATCTCIYMYRRLWSKGCKPPNLILPISMVVPFKAKPSNLMTANISGYTVQCTYRVCTCNLQCVYETIDIVQSPYCTLKSTKAINSTCTSLSLSLSLTHSLTHTHTHTHIHTHTHTHNL